MVPNPYPTQERPWVHRCLRHGCRMVERAEGGIECPVCSAPEWTPAPALSEVR